VKKRWHMGIRSPGGALSKSIDQSSSQGGGEVRTVLLAGNDGNIRSILDYRLSKEGYSVLVSDYGSEAFEKARTARPDLIILDLAAPQLDGLEFLDELRRTAETKSIPVLVVSTYRAEELGIASPDLQDVECVLMPFSPRELVADVERIVSARYQPC
jgi:DNA-binding response OmpR family regulator